MPHLYDYYKCFVVRAVWPCKAFTFFVVLDFFQSFFLSRCCFFLHTILVRLLNMSADSKYNLRCITVFRFVRLSSNRYQITLDLEMLILFSIFRSHERYFVCIFKWESVRFGFCIIADKNQQKWSKKKKKREGEELNFPSILWRNMFILVLIWKMDGLSTYGSMKHMMKNRKQHTTGFGGVSSKRFCRKIRNT